MEWKYTTNVGPTKALIVEADGSTVVEVANRTHDSRFEANVRLMTAAPELLAALEQVVEWLDHTGESRSAGGMEYGYVTDAHAAIRRAREVSA